MFTSREPASLWLPLPDLVDAVRELLADQTEDDEEEDEPEEGLQAVGEERGAHAAHGRVECGDHGRDRDSHPPVVRVGLAVEAGHDDRVGPDLVPQAVEQRQAEAEQGHRAV